MGSPMNKIKAFLYFALSILVYSEYSIADTETMNTLQQIIHEIEEESEDIVGGAIAIIANNKVIYKKSFGYKEINGSLVNEDTLFNLASVSKPIIATAIGVLEEKGIANFTDTIVVNSKNIPLKKVLSHTTGYRIRGDHEIEKGLSKKDLLLVLKKEPQKNSSSDNVYFYSNLLYSLTKEYVEKKGCKIENLIKELTASLDTLPLKSDNLAYPHSKEKEKLPFPSPYQLSVPASAGIFASLNGMIEFLQITLGNRPDLISRKTLNKMFETVTQARDVINWKVIPFEDREVQSSYCLGWRKLTLKKGNGSTLIFHSGFINGATAFVGMIPEHQVGIVILANQSSRFPLKNGLKIWKAMTTSNYK